MRESLEKSEPGIGFTGLPVEQGEIRELTDVSWQHGLINHTDPAITKVVKEVRVGGWIGVHHTDELCSRRDLMNGFHNGIINSGISLRTEPGR